MKRLLAVAVLMVLVGGVACHDDYDGSSAVSVTQDDNPLLGYWELVSSTNSDGVLRDDFFDTHVVDEYEFTSTSLFTMNFLDDSQVISGFIVSVSGSDEAMSSVVASSVQQDAAAQSGEQPMTYTFDQSSGALVLRNASGVTYDLVCEFTEEAGVRFFATTDAQGLTFLWQLVQ